MSPVWADAHSNWCVLAKGRQERPAQQVGEAHGTQKKWPQQLVPKIPSHWPWEPVPKYLALETNDSQHRAGVGGAARQATPPQQGARPVMRALA